MDLFKIFILAVIQGVTELLPVSSSAHVIVAEKLMGLDPTSPEMTFLLIMLHTGTMFAVILFFWKSWKATFFASEKVFKDSVRFIAIATFMTGVIGLSLKFLVEKFFLNDMPHAEIELLFGNMQLISIALASVGILIIFAGWKSRRCVDKPTALDIKKSFLIGAVQGVCLLFRGFSRSGATISTGLLLGMDKKRIEDFSFALAVVLTPPIIMREAIRLLKTQHSSLSDATSMVNLFLPGLIGMGLSFAAGTLALRWLSNWLEQGRWYLFGIYCLCASLVIFLLFGRG